MPQAQKSAATPLQAEVKVWDPLVRTVHWSLVASFIVAWESAISSYLEHHNENRKRQ